MWSLSGASLSVYQPRQRQESETQERSPFSVREKRRGAMSHEDIAVQRQFCAKFIIQCVKPYTKCFCRLLCEFYQKALLVIYAGTALKLEKLGSIFKKISIHVHPCHP